MTRTEELRRDRAALIEKIASWQARIASDTVDDSHSRHRHDVWRERIADARAKIASIDTELRGIETDAAAREVPELIAAIEAHGAVPQLTGRLQELLSVLRLHKRIGASAEMVSLKLERLTSLGAHQGVRVADKWSDFAGWIRTPPATGRDRSEAA